MKIRTADDIVTAINTSYAKAKEERARRYIGASIVGDQCDNYLALSMRGFPNDPPSPQLKRIFALGHALEDQVVADLKKHADLRVWEVDGLTGKQHTYTDWGGHISCHMDGHIELDDDVVRCLEIKSMNRNSFDKFQTYGVKRSHPHYFAQLQMMMGMSGFTEAVFISLCKDNSAYHAQLVAYDEIEFAFIRARVERILEGGRVSRITDDPLDWRCQGCFKRTSCWDGLGDATKACALCIFARPRDDGEWQCSLHNKLAREVCSEFQEYRAKEE